MVSNGVSRGRPGRTPQFLTLGLLVVICILAFNYWNVSSRSRLLQRQVQEMTGTLEELAMKKVHLEKRSEALQSQIGDANKMNTGLKTEKELCIEERDMLARGKNELVIQVKDLTKEKEDLKKNVSYGVELKKKYDRLMKEYLAQKDALTIAQSQKTETDNNVARIQNEVLAIQEQCKVQQRQASASITELQNALLEAKQKCAGNTNMQQNGNQVLSGRNYNQQQVPDQQHIQQQQDLLQKQEQFLQQQQQQQLVPNQPYSRQQNQQPYFQQKMVELQQHKQQQQQQQQEDQDGHLVYQPVRQNLQNPQAVEGIEEKQVNQDPGPIEMEANADHDLNKDQNQQQMFPEREDEEEKDDGNHRPGQQDMERNNVEDVHDLPQKQIEENEAAQDEEEESEVSDAEERRMEEEDKDVEEEQVQAPGQGDDDEDENSVSEPGRIEADHAGRVNVGSDEGGDGGVEAVDIDPGQQVQQAIHNFRDDDYEHIYEDLQNEVGNEGGTIDYEKDTLVDEGKGDWSTNTIHKLEEQNQEGFHGLDQGQQGFLGQDQGQQGFNEVDQTLDQGSQSEQSNPDGSSLQDSSENEFDNEKIIDSEQEEEHYAYDEGDDYDKDERDDEDDTEREDDEYEKDNDGEYSQDVDVEYQHDKDIKQISDDLQVVAAKDRDRADSIFDDDNDVLQDSNMDNGDKKDGEVLLHGRVDYHGDHYYNDEDEEGDDTSSSSYGEDQGIQHDLSQRGDEDQDEQNGVKVVGEDGDPDDHEERK